jgi:hypothetical protein
VVAAAIVGYLAIPLECTRSCDCRSLGLRLLVGRMQRKLAGEKNIRVHRQIHGHVYGCKNDVTLVLYDPDSNERVLL